MDRSTRQTARSAKIAKKAAKRTTKRQSQQKGKDLARRKLTEDEQARLAACRERVKETQPAKLKKCDDSDKPGAVMPGDPDDPLLGAKMAEAIGSTDADVQGLLFDQTVKTFRWVFYSDDVDRDGMVGATNQALAPLSEIRPRDEIEAVLAAKMIGAHNMATEAKND